MPPTLRSAAGSDIGRRRTMNQDSAYVSHRLLGVADGMGGHAHGELASSIAVATLAELDARLEGADLAEVDLLAELGSVIDDAVERLSDAAEHDPELRGMGTTLVALLVDGSRIGVVHIGDSRAYVLRDGELHQLTVDHTLVQTLVDEGRITAEEAAVHPRRSVLVRTLQESGTSEPDLFLHEGRPGDRYLICSDGLTAVLSDDELAGVLGSADEPAAVVDRLVAMANEGGGPDNITCIVADLLDSPASEGIAQPLVVGAAAADRPAR